MVPENFSLWIVFKNLTYVGAMIVGLSVHSYGILVIFIILDTVLGIARVGIVHGRQALRSLRMTSGIVSKISIIFVPVVLAYTGKGIGLDLTGVAQSALGVLILAQAYSILGNIHSIYLRKDVYEFDAVSFVLTKVQLFVERFIKAGAPDKSIEIPPTNRDQEKL